MCALHAAGGVQANGVRCFTALEFPRGAEQLAQVLGLRVPC